MGDTVTDFITGRFFFLVRIPISHEDTLRQLCNSHAVTTSTHARCLEQNETVHKSGIDNTVRLLHSAGQQAAHRSVFKVFPIGWRGLSLLVGRLEVNMFLIFVHRILLGGLYPSLSSGERAGDTRAWLRHEKTAVHFQSRCDKYRPTRLFLFF